MSSVLTDPVLNGPLAPPGRPAVKAASTTAVILANVMAGFVLDGVVLVTGDRILLKNQADPIENGIYDVLDTSSVRSQDLPAGLIASMCLVYVSTGTLNAVSGWMNIAYASLVGTDPLEWRYLRIRPRIFSSLIHLPLATTGMVYAPVAYYAWIMPTLGFYNLLNIIVDCDITGDSLNVQIRDITNAIVLGGQTGIAVSGIYQIDVLTPLTAARLVVEISQSGAGVAPVIYSLTLSWSEN